MAQAPHVITGIVRDSRGSPVAQARVYFTSGPAPFPDIAGLTGNDGTFALSVPSPGTYKIECVAEGFAPTSVTVVVTDSQTTQIEIRLGNG